MSVTYTAVLAVEEAAVEFVAGLLEGVRRAKRTRWRALTCLEQAVLGLRWFIDGSRITQLATDNSIGKTTAYDYLQEVIDALAARAPGLHGALLAAKAAGHEHVSVDGTLIATDRIGEPGLTVRKGSTTGRSVDRWWSGKHRHHGGNVQVVTVPDGWPIWVSPVRPGRTHDVTAMQTHSGMLPALREWTADERKVLTDRGYEGEEQVCITAVKKPAGGQLTEEQKAANKAHNSKRAVGECGNSLLKTTFKALRRVSLCPWRIGAIVAAALVLLHIEHDRMV
ncbi:HARBI1 family protein [Nocardia crassostreae]|uniref:HARBI1 family protein n=1 Tax=Nocardia crassostreae TaxID=53428 RepID=UPI000834FA59|nr:transposase family protein [Nocardia crassostreae]